MPVSFHFLYDKLLKSSQLNAGCLQHMHTAILFLKALYQSRAAITILTVMTSPQHVHGKNCHAFLSPRQYAIHCLLFMNGMEMDILFHKSLQQFTECSVYTRMIDNKQIGTAAFPAYLLQTCQTSERS